ncbi:MAG: prepilin-type N-terminal cleavage/methylation domain-containing protein [Pseudomonadota bacterium]|nr:prepilin-type N-terminal cleavage/methylation domain-containing protein [Pseudomonadota bacterium]QKK05854.1 MAG: prepilin-type N-terminal cleavage/methylation domain-containing protein [Pseudomonadota bacterium]
MKTRTNEKGFTLVELAIVMAIIGLLIGGILKGQELMENARVASTVTQVKAIEAAMTTFRDTFNAIPGDMARADVRLPACNANCLSGGANVGDGTVGIPLAAGREQGVTTGTALPGGDGDETTLFWVHMLVADLLGGLTDVAIQDGSFIGWGDTHPAAKIGGGFVVGHSGGLNTTQLTGLPGRPAGAPDNIPVGTVLVLKSAVAGDFDNTAGVQAVSPLRAAQIDRRIDDGQAASGTVQSYGDATSCYFDINADGSQYVYAETVKAKDCGMMLQIQG